MRKRTSIAFGAMAGALAASTALADPIVFSDGGNSDPTSINATVNAFRAELGEPNNGSAAGPLPGGRREINWDGGGGVDVTTLPVTPFDVFLDSRGARFTTPGLGLSQAPPSGGPTNGLAAINPTYGTTFSTFSPLRLFVPIESNITDGSFFLPGTAGAVPATVSGFGAVFTDVDLTDSTQIEYFNAGGKLLFSSFVEPGVIPEGSLSFLGVVFDAGEKIARVRITTGTSPLGPTDNPGEGVDVVAMDDFVYGEPVARVVAEPSMLGLLAVVGFALGRVRKRPKSGISV